MDNTIETIKFTYTFFDEDEGLTHEVTSEKCKDCVTVYELCEMFVDFIQSAGYSTDPIFKYFNGED